ncbi:MAG: methyltransferase domain-containing protein [Salegentibacter sp.]
MKANSTSNAIAIFDQFAEGYQEKYMDQGLYRESLDLFCSQLSTPNAHILDAGCGPGNISRYLLKKRPDLQILGIDLSPNMLALARKNNPSGDFRKMDCRNIDRLNQKFDGIVAGFCLPYLSEEEMEKFIKDAAAKLNPDGLLYISTMEDDPERSGWKTSSSGKKPELYIRYCQAASLVKALEENQLKVLDLRRVKNPQEKEETCQDLLLIAKK